MGQPNQPANDQATEKDASKTTTDNANDQNDTGKDVGKDAGKDTGKDDDTAGLKKALKAERQRADALEKEKRDAELSRLPELEQAKARLTELEAENAKLKTEVMRRQIGMELGLPWNLARRIQGDDEDAMRDDAKDLLKTYKSTADDNGKQQKEDKDNKRPPNDAKRNGPAGKLGMNELFRIAAGKA